MRKLRTWSDQWMSFKQFTGSFDSLKIAIGNFPICVYKIPLELLFHVRNKCFGLANAHAVEDLWARWRMAAKSALVSGLAGLSAASSNHDSNSGVTSNGLQESSWPTMNLATSACSSAGNSLICSMISAALIIELSPEI